MSCSISVGLFDWTRFAGANQYYPEDLPGDWRLDYFSNEFESCCIDLAAVEKKPDQLREWIEDVDDSFELCFALSSDQHLSLFEQVAGEVDGGRVYALILDVAATEPAIQQLAQGGRTATIGHLQAIKIRRLADLWRPETATSQADFALMPCTDDVHQLRVWVETWTQEMDGIQDEGRATLWLPAYEADARQLMALRQLVELMGH